MESIEIRRRFLNFFKREGHLVLPSASLQPIDDPTLLFTNAGMVPFKNFFLGQKKPPAEDIVTIQKCLRVSGKHNDLENVGFTPRHHTFFEMMGNFSFGGYFKEKACELAWQFLTEEVKLPAEKLWIAVVEDDEETFRIWTEKLGLPSARIKKYPLKELFWEMGEVGPCGPCTEIHYDFGVSPQPAEHSCHPLCDCGRFLEIWNLVFQEKEKKKDGTLRDLPTKNIDTGMGLERLASLLQNKTSNFETDLLSPLIGQLEKITQKTYQKNPRESIAMRVIADHLRALVFAITDGIYPSNTAEGYVLRKLLRRAARYGRKLKLFRPFLYLLVPKAVEIMKVPYPELLSKEEEIGVIILGEEKRFEKIISVGEEVFSQYHAGQTISGEEIYYYYDTLGIPLDLMEEIAKEKKLILDKSNFEKKLAEQKKRSRLAGRDLTEPPAISLPQTLPPTEFVGYEQSKIKTKILEVIEDRKTGLILEKTPFYAEEGGQISDQGIIRQPNGEFLVEKVEKIKDIYLHWGRTVKGEIKEDFPGEAEIDVSRRKQIAANHTATHLLHQALRMVLGENVRQAGSLVADDYLRFDFTHSRIVEKRELNKVEGLVNGQIRKNLPVEILNIPYEEAKRKGARALFEGKYEKIVRVVKIGDFSLELCGGTHLKATGEIGLFKITQEVSVAAGVRRIEALTAETAYLYSKKREENLNYLLEKLKIREDNLKAVEKIIEEQRTLRKENQKLKSKVLNYTASDILKTAEIIKGVKVVRARLELDPASLRILIDRLAEKIGSGLVILGSTFQNKAILMVKTTADLGTRYPAGDLVKKISAHFGGKGGGSKNFAQAGGGKVERIPSALAAVEKEIANR